MINSVEVWTRMGYLIQCLDRISTVDRYFRHVILRDAWRSFYMTGYVRNGAVQSLLLKNYAPATIDDQSNLVDIVADQVNSRD